MGSRRSMRSIRKERKTIWKESEKDDEESTFCGHAL